MNKNVLIEQEFKKLRDICHKNPPEYLQKAPDYKKQYSFLTANHFLFINAYAYCKIGNYKEAEPLLRDLLVNVKEEENYFFLVHGNLLLSQCFRQNAEQTMIFIELAQNYASEAQDPLLLAASLAYLGDFHFRQNNLDLAEKFHLQVQKILGKDGDPLIKLQSLFSLANTSISVKKFKNALNHLYNCLEISENDNNFQFSLLIKNTLAKVLIELGKYNEAEKFLLEASELSLKQGLVMARLQVLFSLAALKLKCKAPQKALLYLDNCSVLAQEISFNNPEFSLDLNNNYAIAHALNNDFEEAMLYMDKAITSAIELGDKVAEQEIYLNLAKILLNVKQFDKAQMLLLKCQKNSKKYKLKEHYLDAQESLAKLYYNTNEYAKCIHLMQKMQNDLQKEVKNLKEVIEGRNLLKPEFNNLQIQPSKLPFIKNDDFVGISSATKEILHQAFLLAKQADVSILIRGESGTGKEVLANLIHNNSSRKNNPFVAVNAPAIASSLMESELFGHKKGSYTGAITNEKGFFLRANKGTLFIDEITEIPIEFQAKLLRVLESRKVIPVGSCTEISFNTRIISSTNRSIKEMLASGLFRLDLFHRINTIEIVIPPLRDRKEDIPILVEHFIKNFCQEYQWSEPNIDSSFFTVLEEYDFPGNVRELKNMIEKLFILGESSVWDAMLLTRICGLGKGIDKTANSLDSQEKDSIIKALIKFKGIRRDAAKYLNISNSTMTRRIGKYGLEGYTSRHLNHK